MAFPLLPVLLVAAVGGGLYALVRNKKDAPADEPIDGENKLPTDDEPVIEQQVRKFVVQNASGLEEPDMPGPWYAYVGPGEPVMFGPYGSWDKAYDAATKYIYDAGDVPDYVHG